MTPSLVIVQTEKKTLITLRQSKNIRIGTCVDSDIIVNHPEVHESEKVLGPDNEETISRFWKRWKLSVLLPVFNLNLPGLKAHLIHLQTLLAVLFVAFMGALVLDLTGSKAASADRIQDWTPIILPAPGVYGNCRQDKGHENGARFRFFSKSPQPYCLYFFAGGLGNGTFLTISINGNKLERPIILPAGWGEERSVKLPPASVRSGENIVEFIPTCRTKRSIVWGISDVRAVITSDDDHIDKAAIPDPDSIIETLTDVHISGQELAKLYKTVHMWDASPTSLDHDMNRERILKRIEQRMEDLLYQTAFTLKSQKDHGNDVKVRQVISETKEWIPDSWYKGWEIYDEFYVNN